MFVLFFLIKDCVFISPKVWYDKKGWFIMLDKSDVKNVNDAKEELVKTTGSVEKEEPVKTPEPVEKEEPVKTLEPVEKEEPVKTVEVTKAPEVTKTAEVVEKPKKTGYLSEIDGVEVDFELQYREQETDMKDIAKRVTEDYTKRGNDASKIELIQVYLKPTDFTAYYVINNSYEGKIPLF